MRVTDLVSRMMDIICLKSPRAFGGPGGNLEKGYALCGPGRRSFAPIEEITRVTREVLGETVSDEVARRTEQVLHAFSGAGLLGISTGGETYEGVLDFFRFCAEVGKDPSRLERDVLISLGYGGTDRRASLRFPVYVLQALELQRQFKAIHSTPPRLRVFTGQMAGLRVNGLDADAVQARTLKNFSLTEFFAQRFYAKNSGSCKEIFFDFDRPVGSLESTVQALAEHLKKSEQGNATLQFARLRAQGRRHEGGNGNGGWETYAALHAFLFGDILPISYSISDWAESAARNDVERQWLISVGAPPERCFNEARWVVAEASCAVLDGAMRRPRGSLRLIFDVSNRPVYYPEPYEPLFCKEAAERLLEGDVRANWGKLSADDPFVGKDYRILASRVGIRQFIEWVADSSDKF